MTLIQVLLLLVIIAFCTATMAAMRKGWATPREGLFLAIVWLVAALAVVWPDETTRIAKVLGVGKGTNLLLYCTVVAMVIGFLMIYARLRALRREMTLLVRQLAIRDAVGMQSSGDPAARAGSAE